MIKLFAIAAFVLLLAGCDATTTRVVVVVTATPSRPQTISTASTATSPASTISPAGFALTSADVPGNMQQTIARFHTNADMGQVYGIDPAELQRRGRITSYETEFQAKAVTGMLEVDDVVASWRSAAGARWDYARVVQAARHPGFRQLSLRTIAAPQLGDRRIAFSFRRKGQSYNVRDFAVVFTRGGYRVYLQVVGVDGTVDDSQVIHLARLIDSRIESAR